MEKRKVAVDLDDLVSVFTDTPLDMTHYLDLKTGEVELVSQEALSELRDIYDDLSPEEQDDPAAVDAAIERSQVPDWQKPELRLAEEIDGDAAGRFLVIPRQETHDSYQDMADFVETVDDERLRERLEDAIQGRGAFSRFKRIVYDGTPREVGDRWRVLCAEYAPARPGVAGRGRHRTGREELDAQRQRATQHDDTQQREGGGQGCVRYDTDDRPHQGDVDTQQRIHQR